MAFPHIDSKILLVFLFFASMIFFMRDLSFQGIEYRDDEIFYFASTQEMMKSGNLLSPTYFGENRFQKPILFYWSIIAKNKIIEFFLGMPNGSSFCLV